MRTLQVNNVAWVDCKFINDRMDSSSYITQINMGLFDLYKKESTDFQIKTLDDICNKIVDGPFGSDILEEDYVEQGVPFIRVQNITEYGFEDSNLVFISEEANKRISRSECRPGDLVFTKTGRLGTVCVLNNEYSNYNIRGDLAKLQLKSQIDPYYVMSYLNSNFGTKITNSYSSGSTRGRILISNIKKIVIPIPSPEIQKYIGDKVRKAEELREEAKRLKKEAEEILNRELNLNKLEESLKSSINSKHNWITSMDINDRIDSYYYKRRYILVNQHLNDYECIQIRDIASVDYGYMPTEDYADENNGVPLIRVTNMIGNLLLDLSDLKYISKSINIPDDKYVDDGDILVVQCGNTTGKIALMTKEVENYLYPSFCLRIKLKNKSINNKYLALLMEMSIIQEQIWQSASYSSVRPNTTKPAIENIRIPLIEKQKQEDVGALVEKYIDNIYQSKQLILEAKQDVEDLIEGNFDMSKVKANS